MGKRTKLIVGIVFGAAIIFSGALFGLAKFGVIKIGILADTFGTKITLTVKNQDGTNSTYTPIAVSQGTSVIETASTGTNGTYIFSNNINPNTTYRVMTQIAPPPGQENCNASTDVTTGSAGSNRILTLTLTCSGGGGGSGGGTGDVCSTTAPCQTGLTCTNGTCQAGGGGATTYCVRGHIQNANTGAAIQGARATVGSASGATDSFGNYQVNNLPFAGLSTAKIRFTKDGFASTAEQNITGLNSNITAGISCDTTSNNNLGTAALIPSTPPLPNTFSEIGTIKDQNDALLGGVTVRVSCNNSDQIPGVACESESITWQSTSYPALQTYYSGLPSTRVFNYEVPNINRYSNYTSFPRLKISFSKSGYFWDQNGDGINNDSGTTIYVPKPTTSYVVNGNQLYLSFYNVKLRSTVIEDKLDFLVFDQNNNQLNQATVKLSKIDGTSQISSSLSSNLVRFYIPRENRESFQGMTVKISRDGYSSKLLFNFSFPSGDQGFNILLTALVPEQTGITGQVLNENDDPIANASVLLYKNFLDQGITVKTDAQGFYQIKNLSEMFGTVTLYAFNEQYINTEKSSVRFLLERPGNYRINLILKSNEEDPAQSIFSVRALLQKDFSPITDAEVDFKINQEVIRADTTDSEGLAQALVPVDVNLTVVVRYNGATQTRTVRTIDISRATEVELNSYLSFGIFYFGQDSAEPEGTLTISVTDKNDNPVADAEVKITVSEDYFIMIFKTASDGKVKIPSFYEGQYDLTKSTNNFMTLAKRKFLKQIGTGIEIEVEVIKNDLEFDESFTLDEKQMTIDCQFEDASPQNITLFLHSSTGQIPDDVDNDYIRANLRLFKKKVRGIEQISNSTYESINTFPLNVGLTMVEIRNLDPGEYVASFKYGGTDFYSTPSAGASNLRFIRLPENSEITMDINYLTNQSDDLKFVCSPKISLVLQDRDMLDWYNQHKSEFEHACQKLNTTMDKIPDIGVVQIIINDDLHNAMAVPGYTTCTINGTENQRCSSIIIGKNTADEYFSHSPVIGLETILFHEFGHQIHLKFIEQQPRLNDRLLTLYNGTASLGDENAAAVCVANRITDSVYLSEPGRFAGHPGDNSGEFFASAFTNFYLNHTQLLASISASGNLSQCQNMLAYLWTYMAEYVGVKETGDRVVFKPVGGSLGNAQYTFSDIKNGKWRQSYFDQLRLTEQIAVQYRRIVVPIFNTLNWANLQTKITQFYDWLRGSLVGSENNYLSIEGSVKKQNNEPVANAFVLVAGKFSALTNTTGNFQIPIAPKGVSVFKVFKNKNTLLKVLDPEGSLINISNENRNFDITVE